MRPVEQTIEGKGCNDCGKIATAKFDYSTGDINAGEALPDYIEACSELCVDSVLCGSFTANPKNGRCILFDTDAPPSELRFVAQDKEGTSEYYYISDSLECERTCNGEADPNDPCLTLDKNECSDLDGYYETKCPITCGVCNSTAIATAPPMLTTTASPSKLCNGRPDVEACSTNPAVADGSKCGDESFQDSCPVLCNTCINGLQLAIVLSSGANLSTFESETEETQRNFAAAVVKRVVAISNDVVVDDIVKIIFTKVLANRVRRAAVSFSVEVPVGSVFIKFGTTVPNNVIRQVQADIVAPPTAEQREIAAKPIVYLKVTFEVLADNTTVETQINTTASVFSTARELIYIPDLCGVAPAGMAFQDGQSDDTICDGVCESVCFVELECGLSVAGMSFQEGVNNRTRCGKQCEMICFEATTCGEPNEGSEFSGSNSVATECGTDCTGCFKPSTTTVEASEAPSDAPIASSTPNPTDDEDDSVYSGSDGSGADAGPPQSSAGNRSRRNLGALVTLATAASINNTEGKSNRWSSKTINNCLIMSCPIKLIDCEDDSACVSLFGLSRGETRQLATMRRGAIEQVENNNIAGIWSCFLDNCLAQPGDFE
jgi:hypothetical protein